MSTTIQVSATLTGRPIDFVALAKRVPLQPSKTWRGGDKIDQSQVCYKQDGWCLALPRVEGLHVSGEILRLLEILEPVEESLRATVQDLGLELEIACVVRIGQQPPSLNLPNPVLARLSTLGASLDVDLYVLPE
jgi:Domain of unknown function (DUF4279)